MAKEKSAVKINPDYLKGLKFQGAEPKMIEKDGRRVQRNIPFERQLAEADVLDWTESGDSVIIVAKDGKKHTVKK